MYIDNLIEKIEYAEDKLEKAENELQHYNDEMKGICVGLIGWIYKHAPKGYESLMDKNLINNNTFYLIIDKVK